MRFHQPAILYIPLGTKSKLCKTSWIEMIRRYQPENISKWRSPFGSYSERQYELDDIAQERRDLEGMGSI